MSAFWNNTIFNVVCRCALSPAAVSLPPQHGPPQHEFDPVIFTSPGPKTIKSAIFNPPPQINGFAAPPHFLSTGVSGSFGGYLEFFACPVKSSKGIQCPRGSFVHAPFCRYHLQKVLNLDVKTSSVPGAGRGLFSITSRRPGDHIVDYFGEVLKKNSNPHCCRRLVAANQGSAPGRVRGALRSVANPPLPETALGRKSRESQNQTPPVASVVGRAQQTYWSAAGLEPVHAQIRSPLL